MPLPRSAAFRSFARPRTASASRTGFASRWRQTSRRGYATEGEKSTQSLSSEFPWIAGAAAATAGGLFFVVNSGSFGPLINHPMPGQDWHGKAHGEDDEDEEEGGEEEESNEKSEDGDDSGDGDEQSKSEDGDDESSKSEKEEQSGGQDEDKDESKDENEDEGESSAAPAAGGRGSKQSGKKVTEQPADGKLRERVKGQEGDEPADWDKEHVLEREGSSTVIHKPDAKGGAKRRIESAYGTKHGELNEEEDGKDKAAASKTPVKDSISGKQAGLSNTDTKHPYDIDKQSRRFEDAPDSAKLQGTVDPHSRS